MHYPVCAATGLPLYPGTKVALIPLVPSLYTRSRGYDLPRYPSSASYFSPGGGLPFAVMGLPLGGETGDPSTLPAYSPRSRAGAPDRYLAKRLGVSLDRLFDAIETGDSIASSETGEGEEGLWRGALSGMYVERAAYEILSAPFSEDPIVTCNGDRDPLNQPRIRDEIEAFFAGRSDSPLGELFAPEAYALYDAKTRARFRPEFEALIRFVVRFSRSGKMLAPGGSVSEISWIAGTAEKLARLTLRRIPKARKYLTPSTDPGG